MRKPMAEIASPAVIDRLYSFSNAVFRSDFRISQQGL
jgi:hypothetical protein